MVGWYDKETKTYENSIVWQNIKEIYQNNAYSQVDDQINQVADRMPKYGQAQYNSASMYNVKPILDNITTLLIENTKLKKHYTNYILELDNIQQKLVDDCWHERKSVGKALNFKDNRIQEFYARSVQQIIQFLKQLDIKGRKSKYAVLNHYQKIKNQIFGLPRFHLRWNSFTKLTYELNKTFNKSTNPLLNDTNIIQQLIVLLLMS